MIGYSLPNYDNWLSKPYDMPVKMTDDEIREQAEEEIEDMTIEDMIEILPRQKKQEYKRNIDEIKTVAIECRINELTK